MIYHNCLTNSTVLEFADVMFLAFLKANPFKAAGSCCGRAVAAPLERDRDRGCAERAQGAAQGPGIHSTIPELEGPGAALPEAGSPPGQRRRAAQLQQLLLIQLPVEKAISQREVLSSRAGRISIYFSDVLVEGTGQFCCPGEGN